MKKLILFFGFMLLLLGAQDVSAQSYLSDIEVNMDSQTISGNFLRGAFVGGTTGVDPTFDISLEISDFGTPIDLTLGSLGNATDASPSIQAFEIPLGDIFTHTDDTITALSSGDMYDNVHILWRFEGGGLLASGDPVMFAGRIIDTDDVVIVDPPDDTIAVIDVDWETPELLNTNPDNPAAGQWYYKIKSQGVVTKEPDGNAYLTMMKIDDTGIATRFAIPLAEYLADTGSTFSVLYPSCIATDTCGGLVSSPIQSGYRYEVFFSRFKNGSELLHDNILFLDPPPGPAAELLDNISIETAQFITDPSTNSSYVEVTGAIANDISGGYKFTIRGNADDGSRDPYSYDIALIPGVSGSYTVPDTSYSMDISYDSYDVIISYVDGGGTNEIVYMENIGSFKEPVSVNNNNGGGIGNTERQNEILKSGIVPTTCGYDVGPGGEGYLCGFTEVVTLIQNVIEYIFILILPIAAIVFAYAGFLLLTSGGSSDKRKAAKKAMVKVIIGILIIMLAWLLVKTILVSLGASAGFTMYLDF